MGFPRKIVAWIGGILLLLTALLFVPPLWNYTSLYPKVWSGKITIDGNPAPSCGLYADVKKERVVIALWDMGSLNPYYLCLTPDGRNFLWRCESTAFSSLPGFLYSNHIQFGKGCMARNVGVAGENGNLISKPSHSRNPALKVGFRSLQFTAEDGRRIKAVW
jgi:hypothetical protein